MKTVFRLLLGVGAAAACAPVDGARNADQPSQIQVGDQRPRPRVGCFPGRGGSPLCWTTVARSELNEQSNLYQYPDPQTDPSFPAGFDKGQYQPPDRLLDLRQIPSNERLSPNFERSELLPEGEARGFFGLFSPDALNRLETLRAEIGRKIRVTSGYRSPGHNAKLTGAARWSRHTYGDAVDFVASGFSFKSLGERCLKHGASFYQVYSSHVHCDWRSLTLDAAYYPVDAALSAIDSFASIAAQIAAEAKIETTLSKKDGANPTLILSVSIPQEDPDELVYEWQVEMQNGAVLTGSGRQMPIPRQPGTHRVRVVVGETVTVTRELKVR